MNVFILFCMKQIHSVVLLPRSLLSMFDCSGLPYFQTTRKSRSLRHCLQSARVWRLAAWAETHTHKRKWRPRRTEPCLTASRCTTSRRRSWSSSFTSTWWSWAAAFSCGSVHRRCCPTWLCQWAANMWVKHTSIVCPAFIFKKNTGIETFIL